MTATLVIGASSVALILFVTFIAQRLMRSRRAGLSIRMQVFLALASIVGAFAFGLGVLVLDRVKARSTLLAEESAKSEAAAISALVRNEMELKHRSLEDVANDLSALRGDVGMTLLGPDGRVVFDPGTTDHGARGTVSVSSPITVGGEIVGSVRVTKQTIVIERTLADFAPTILSISALLGAAAALAAALIGRTIASPIEQLTEFAVKVSEGNLRERPPPAQGREVMRLVKAIETMRRELEGRPFVETFAADLSHELKNPVAAIRASAEVLADGALEEPKEAARFVDRIQEATGRIELLLGELLSLARIEARGVEDAEPVDLAAVLEAVAARGREREAEIEVVASPARVRGDLAWLTRLCENLVDNAIQHGDGRVRLALEATPKTVTLRVENAGRVDEHVKKRLFRRFVTTRPDRGGTGLGLAIARAVTEAHGGTIRCAEHGPPRVVFTLDFPAAG